MASVKIECVASKGYGIGESPVWDEKESALLCVDITGRKVCRWSAVTKQVEAIAVGKEWLPKRSAEGGSCACWLSTASLPNAGRAPDGEAAAAPSCCMGLACWRPIPKTWRS